MMRQFSYATVAALLFFGFTAANDARAQGESSDWTRFRGANGTGAIQQCNVPLPWQESDVCWELELPGIGNSSPVVFGDRVFLMSANADSAERYLLSYDLKTGEQIWSKSVESTPHHLHKRSSYASGTPCVNKDAVFFTWATPESLMLVSLTHDGEEIWKRDLGRYVSSHGYGSSPALYGDLLILFNSQAVEQIPEGVEPGKSQVTAFDPKSGDVKWETPRTTTRACYGVPTLYKDPNSGKDALLFSNTGDGMFALDLQTGKPLWNKKVFAKRSVSCPIVIGDLGIGTEGSGGGGNILFAVDLKGQKHELKFSVKNSAPYVPSPVSKGDLVFLWNDNGIVSCVKLPAGDVLWRKRIGGNVSTSPVIAGDKIVGISEDGTVTILSASENYQKLGSIELGDVTRATPLVHEDYLLIRTNSKLICVGKP